MYRFGYNYFLFLIIFFYFFPFFTTLPSQIGAESLLDPAIRGDYFQEIIRSEENLYNKVSSLLKKRPQIFLKTDLLGRNYSLKWNGSIQFSGTEGYFPSFPDSRQIDLHKEEAEMLSKKNPYQAIQLLKGIELCLDLFRDRENKTMDSFRYTIVNQANRLLDYWSHKEYDLIQFADPGGCYYTDPKTGDAYTYIRSFYFSYTVGIQGRFYYFFPDSKNSPGKNQEKILTRTELLYIPHNEKKTDLSLEQELIRSANPDAFSVSSDSYLKFLPKNKHILSINSSQHEIMNQFTSDTYYTLWDGKRGLNNFTKKQIDFKREKKNGHYVSSFTKKDMDGSLHKFVMKELYYLRGKRGHFFLLSSPEEFSKEQDTIWNSFVKNLIVR